MLANDHLEFWARVTPGAIAAEDGRVAWTFAELDEGANRFAHALASSSVAPGDRFAILARNRLEWLILYFGAFKAGAVPVPLNYRLHPREWLTILCDSRARLLVASDEYVDAVETVRHEMTHVSEFVDLDGAGTSGWDCWGEWLGSQSTALPHVPISVGDELYQMYTSGTTGRPKGAVLTHGAVTANMAQTVAVVQVRRSDRALIVMPLYHAGAAMSMLTWLGAGATLVIREQFDPEECVRLLDEDHVAVAAFVPAMIQSMLVDVPLAGSRRYEDLRVIAYGASPIAEETLRQAVDVFGCQFVQSYGMTETSAVLTMLLDDDHRRALAGEPGLLLSCGRPVAGTQVRVVDAEDCDLPPGAIGEIVARGPQLMKEYWDHPAATSETLRDGWLHTGDAGYLDDQGFLYIADRVKDMIVSGGENIYPREIEDVLFAMPEVADAAVIGVPDERWGEAVKAVVVPRAGCVLTEDAVISWCRGHLAGFKRPRSVDFVDAIPRNPSGKVQKTELRAPYWQGRSRSVS